jgi:hypothetical protein
MLKTIPKSSVSRRAFPVYKQWEVTQQDYQIISASLESGLFDTGSSNKQGNIYTTPLYRSIKAKFYNHSHATVFNTFGRYENLSNIANERTISDTIYILKLPQSKYGEEIKPGSISFNSDGLSFSDDGKGNITSDVPRYIITLLDFENQNITIVDNDGQVFNGTISSFDVQSGNMTATFDGYTDSFTVVLIDIQNEILQTAVPLNTQFPGLSIDQLIYGNVFYDEGLFVFTTPISSSYNLNYRSTKTIYETEVLVSARAGEFNYSQNPTAIDVTLSGSYYGEVTPLTNQIVGTNYKKYKVVEDKKIKQYFTGSLGSSTGSWDDYFEYNTTDPTGSYLAPYITTIGLYDDAGDMVAIAKLPTPIKNLPDYDMNFIVRFDT